MASGMFIEHQRDGVWAMKMAYLGALALMAMAGPAIADVKAGVDAWSRGDYDKAVAEWRKPAIAGDADA